MIDAGLDQYAGRRQRPGTCLAGASCGWLLVAAIALAAVAAGPAGMAEEIPATGAAAAAGSPVLGKVVLDRARRAVAFPAVVNQRSGLVEYVLVTEQGKTHESVLRTEAAPRDIHVALLLLNARPASSPVFPDDPAAPLPGVPVRIEASWVEDGREVRRPLEDLVITTNRGDRLVRGPWAYTGSYVSRGTFVAQEEGSIVALQVDPSALINNPRPGRENDELHHVNPQALPAGDQAVTVTIRVLDVTRTNTPILRARLEQPRPATSPEAAPPI